MVAGAGIEPTASRLGFVFDWKAMRWMSREVSFEDWRLGKSVWDNGNICGVPFCNKLSAYNDAKYVALCRGHYSYVLSRRKKGEEDVYKNIEEIRKRGGRPAVNKPENEYSDIDYVRKKLDAQQIQQVRNLLALGATFKTVTEKTKVPEHIVSFILYNTGWK